MNIGGHGIREHVRLLAPLFVLIAAVWALRMVADFAGAPRGLVRVISVSVTGSVVILLAVVLIYVKKFGSYVNVCAATFMLMFWKESLISGAIAFSALTGIGTIYSAPEFSGGTRFPLTPFQHILGHITFGLAFQSLLGAGMGCLILWILRVLVPEGQKSQ